MDFQAEKSLVLKYFSALSSASAGSIANILPRYVADDWLWRGYHPFNELIGVEAVSERFWEPLLQAFSALHRRQDIFFAGRNQVDGLQSAWVVSMGHLVGLFDAHFLGIPPTGKMAFFRYCEFNRVADGVIQETAFFFDLPHLMVQTGLQPFASQRGAELVQPGPLNHSGLRFGVYEPAEGEQTLAAINRMIADLGQWTSGMTLEEELARTWHNDMIWWGPTGIGATATIARYALQHSGPFRAAFTERSKTRHICRLAEDKFGGFFGWPNFTARLRQPYLGVPPSDVIGEFRVIDLYRRKGDKLAENWVFIDLLHWLHQNGRDLLREIVPDTGP